LHVCKNMVQIAQGLSLKEDQKLIVETVTLFHDIGRFPQYAKYKTFRDNISVNHGVLGAETLIEKNILEKLAGEEQEIIIQAVKFHNAFSIPKKEKEDIIFFIKLRGHAGSGLVSCIRVTRMPRFLPLTNSLVSEPTSTLSI